VQKDKRLIQKLMVDDKRCYLFGRNKQFNNFVILHRPHSCAHITLIYNKNLNRAILTDLGIRECTNGRGGDII
jgi:nuclear inhibitor of protein phosphatase 1